jgi:membrane dipeptidase
MSDSGIKFDYNIYGVPMELYLTERITTVMESALDEGKGGFETLHLMEEEQVRQLREDPSHRKKLRNVYESANINLFSVTISEGNLNRWIAIESAVDWLEKVTTPADAVTAVKNDKVGFVLNTQHVGEQIDGELDALETLYNYGIRFGQLTYNTQNDIGSGCIEHSDGGLSLFGTDVVSEMNKLGMVVDLSHCGLQTTLDAIDVSSSPVAYTHAGCAEVSPNPRMKSDEELAALADNDGWLGLLMISNLIADGREDEVIDVFFEQLEHARSILGIERIGLASDWHTMAPSCVPEQLQPPLEADYYEGHTWTDDQELQAAQGFGDINRYSELWKLKEEFERRGYSEEEIDYVFGRSFIDFWERAG